MALQELDCRPTVPLNQGRVALFSWKGEEGQPPEQLRIEAVEPDGRTAWDSSLSLSSNHRRAVHPVVFSSDASQLFVVTRLEKSDGDGPRQSRTALHRAWGGTAVEGIPRRHGSVEEFMSMSCVRVLVHDIGNSSTMKPNQIIVLGPGDRTIAQHYEPNVAMGSYHFDADSGHFYFADRRTNLCRIDLRTGKREERLPIGQIASASEHDSASVQPLRQLASGPPYEEREVEPPVWDVEIRGPRVRTLRNQFLDQTFQRFPWSRIPIRLPGERFLARVAWLEVGEDGTPRNATIAPGMGGILDAQRGAHPAMWLEAWRSGTTRWEDWPDIECVDALSFAITSRGILWSNAWTYYRVSAASRATAIGRGRASS